MQVPQPDGNHFPASLEPLFVEELSDVLPTCVCYHVESLGSFFWSLEYFFDAVVQALECEGAQALSQPLELNKFTRAVQSRLAQPSAKEFLGDHCFHKKPLSQRWGF